MDRKEKEFFISDEAKPLYDFIASKETCSIYKTPSGNYFSHRQKFMDDKLFVIESQSIKIMTENDFLKMECFIQKNIPQGHVAISIFPDLEYLPF